VLGALGGVVGVGVGWGLGKIAAFAISALLNRGGGGPPGGFTWPSVVSLDAALFAMLVAGIIGVVAGILPAFRAAFLPPTDALRHV
jgi:ABC-type antimicrobial peptide transport system permease subunit